MGKAIGIDLGTTNSVVAYKDTAVKIIQTGANNEDLCRSCVALDKSNQFLVGNTVYHGWKRYTPNIVVSVKRLMGTAFSDPMVQKMKSDKRNYPYGIKKPGGGTDEAVSVVLRGREFSPEQISAEILKSLKNDANTKLGGDVTHAVITIPAYFTAKQKEATKKAAELAGIHVQRLLAEPTAAAISYGFDKMVPGESKNILVYDFGGGTFDLSILMALDGQFIESGSGGDRWLGGDDIDRVMIDYVCHQIEQRDGFALEDLINDMTEKEKAAFEAGLKSGVEDAKKTLSQVEKATIFFSDFLENEDGDPVDDYVITKECFEIMIRPLIQRTIDLIEELLANTNIPQDAIDNILLVGGSSCIPLIRKMLGEKFGVDKVMSSEKPMLAIAEGAAILAKSLPSDEVAMEEMSPLNNNDDGGGFVPTTLPSTKHQTFIELANPDGSHRLEKIIDAQLVLPHEANRKFRTMCDNQKIVEVKLFTDVENGNYEKLASGFFVISDNLPALSDLNFSFNLDEDETLSAKVKIVKTGKVVDIRLCRGLNDSSCLSELSQKLDEILSNDEISNSKKAAFMNEMQNIVDTINKENLSPESSKWSEFEQDIRSAYARAMMGEKQENNIGKIFALILLHNFSKYLSSEDTESLREGLLKLKNSKDSFEKDSIRQNLENISNNYQLLITIFFFKIIGESSQNPKVAARALCVYDELMNALANSDIGEVNELIHTNSDLLKELSDNSIDLQKGLGGVEIG